jgi:hypothetical protein
MSARRTRGRRSTEEIFTPKAYNPLSEDSLSESLRRKLEEQPILPLPPPAFRGAGLYALYYVGGLTLYADLKRHDPPVPIYVGKAEAGSSSYGRPHSGTDATKLWDRIKDHTRSIRQATENLRTEDFQVRYLVMSDAWIVLGESALLQAYYPVLWNTFVTGLGSNPAGADRRNGRSIWDTLHGGRSRAAHLPPNRYYTREEADQLVVTAVELFLHTWEHRAAEALDVAPERRRLAIWSAGEQGEPLRVHDQTRYLSEMGRLGLQVPEHVIDETAPELDELLPEEPDSDDQE